MANGQEGRDYSLDDASEGFRSLERALSRRTARTTRARQDANAIRASVETWFRTYRPRLVGVLGDLPSIERVDGQLQQLRARVGTQFVIADLRAELRAIVRTIDREVLPAYDAARWTEAATQGTRPAGQQALAERLATLSPDLAASYQQVHRDLADDGRGTFLGPAGEIREVMRGAIHLLAPDGDVRAQPWFQGDQGRPTQTERIRYILQQSSASEAAPGEAADIVDTKVARLGRLLYSRASGAFHAGTQRAEVNRIVGYAEAVLNEILPL
jgi:hypothetical protein